MKDFFRRIKSRLFLIYPIVDGNGPFSVLLYLIGQLKARHLSLSKDIMESRSAYSEFVGYTPLFLVVTLDPCCEFIHLTPFFIFFLCTNIRDSDTFVRITRKCIESNFFDMRILR